MEAREYALEVLTGDPDDAYEKCPLFMNELQERNHGSVIGVEVDAEGHFKYAFIALGACIRRWRKCKPFVVVDATFLTGCYRGSLFTACTKDANNGILVLAFSIGDSDSNDSWSWFLRKFKEAYDDRDEMCFISDQHLSIEYAVRDVYLNTMHGFCPHHLLQNIRKAYGYAGKNITKPFNATARVYTKYEFEYQMKQLDQINVGIQKDLVSILVHYDKCYYTYY